MAQPGELPAGWRFHFLAGTGHPDGDKIVLIREEGSFIRLDIEAPGIRSMPEERRRAKARRLVLKAIDEVSRGVGAVRRGPSGPAEPDSG